MEVLRVLAEKFGTTTEFLWGIMVKQAYVFGITALVAFVVSGIFTFSWNRFAWSMPFPHEDEDKTFGVGMARLIGTGFIFVWLCFFLSSLIDIATAFANPEYWALKQVLGGWKK